MKLYRFLIFGLLLFSDFLIINAKPELNILDYDLLSYPKVNSRYFYFGNDNLPHFDLAPSSLSISHNGNIVSITNHNCKTQNPEVNSSTVLTMDLSLSSVDVNYFSKAIDFSYEFIKYLPLYKGELAITGFDIISYLNQEFTQDTALLNQGISYFTNKKGSIIDSGFLFNPTGSLDIAKTGKYSKSIVFLTFGSSDIDVTQIVAIAKANGIKIYPVIFGSSESKELNDVANQTGGHLFRITSKVKNYKPIILSIFALINGYIPCDLSWNNKLICDEINTVRISVPKDTIFTEISFNIPDSTKPRIENEPPFLRFSSVIPSSSKSLYLNIISRNGDIQINSLLIKNPRFTIDSGDIKSPLLLMKDQIHTIKVKFSPTDSSIVFDSLSINSNACSGNYVLITGGFPNTPPNTKTLKLLSPNCNNHLIIGDTVDVSWTGLLPADVIQLFYSTNSGKVWDTLKTDLLGLTYKWIVPDLPSDSCLIKIVQQWPNNFGRTMVLRHKGGVNCANFNVDGSLVITASKDLTNIARIWNANNGSLIMELVGHNKPLNWVSFDYQDNYAVSASDDSTAIIWDIKKGIPYKVLFGHKGVVRSANFSPDGRYVVTASNDGVAYVWSVQSGKRIDSLCCTGSPLWYACFSPEPEGRYILTTDNNGKVIIWDTQLNKNQNIFDLKFGVVPYASFSNDLKKLAVSSWFGFAAVYDIATKTELYKVKHDTTKIVPINSSNFDADGKLLLTAGTDTIPRLWDATTGIQKVGLLNEHTSSVQTAVFNFDAKRILTASWDSTAKVWNGVAMGLQIDTSDCVFSISKLNVIAKDIKFPTIPYNNVYDTIVNGFIVNKMKFPVAVKSYRLSGINPEDFEIIDKNAPFTLNGIDSNTLEIRFKPTGIGSREADLEIYLPGNMIKAKLTGSSFDQGLQVLYPIIDYKKVEIGDYKDTLFVAIKNRSPREIKIQSIKNIGPDLIHFNIISGSDSLVLRPNETHSLNIRYTPESIGRTNGMIETKHNAEGPPLLISLFGQGILPRVDTATVLIEDISGKPGEIITLPIKLSNISSNGLSNSIIGFTGELSFNSTLLEPLDGNYGIDIVNGTRKIKVNLNSTFSSDSIIGTVKFKVGLGNDTTTSLKVESLRPLGKGKLLLNKKDGLFKLTGICYEGGTRLIETEGRISLAQNVPNPVSGITDISFEIIEKGLTKLYLIDVLGNTVLTIINQELKPNSYTIQLNSSDLPAGKLFYVLETPTQKLVKSMDIIK